MDDKTNYIKLNKSIDKLIGKATSFSISTPLMLTLFIDKKNNEYFPALIYKGCYENIMDMLEKVEKDFNIPDADFEKLVTKFDNTISSSNFIITDRKLTKAHIDDYIYNGFIIYPYSLKQKIKELGQNPFIEQIYLQKIDSIGEGLKECLDIRFSLDEKELRDFILPYTDAIDDVLNIKLFDTNNFYDNKYDHEYIELLSDLIINNSHNFYEADKIKLKEIDNILKDKGVFSISDRVDLYKDFIKSNIQEIQVLFKEKPSSEDKSILYQLILMLSKYTGVYCYNFYISINFDY